MHALDIEDLVKRYPTGTEALKGVSLHIEEGEFFGLLGPNGAGKSTLIHCTTGLAQPTSGSIRVFGHDAVHHYGEARTAVGLAPQELNLDWFLTLEEQLDYHGGYFGMSRKDRRERTKELLEEFSLTSKKDDRTRTLSRRHEAPAGARPRADAPPAPADPGRADRAASTSSCGSSSGTTSSASTPRARRSCSPRTTSKRPSSSAARSPSSTAARSSPPGRAVSWRRQYGVNSLEDAYLALVGRGELSRAHIAADAP